MLQSSVKGNVGKAFSYWLLTELTRKGFMGSRKKTQEQVIQEFKDVHGNTYSYDNFVYKGVKEKSWVTCKVHGDFLTDSDQHRQGVACKLCSYKAIGDKNRKSESQWLEDLLKVHKDKYLFDVGGVRSNKDKIKAFCKDHGWFAMKASHLLSGHGCHECSTLARSIKRRSTLEEWTTSCTERHNSFYTYELCKSYEGQNTEMLVTCPLHGPFEIKACHHKAGRGCTKCAQHGYDKTSPSYLYILQADDLTKIGITGFLPSVNRVKDINRKSGKDFSVVHTFYYEHGGEVHKIEQQVLKHFRSLFEQPTVAFSGSTECFYDLDPEIAKQYIEPFFARLIENKIQQHGYKPIDKTVSQ